MSTTNTPDNPDIQAITNHHKKYSRETRQKYGHTDAYKQSRSKMAKYTKKDLLAIMQKGNEIFCQIAALMDESPSDPRVQETVHRWRQHITDNFYDCSLEILQGLGEAYVDDKRFTMNIDKTKPGLALFLRDSIRIYCQVAEQ